jgi:cellulose synthase operon protein C
MIRKLSIFFAWLTLAMTVPGPSGWAQKVDPDQLEVQAKSEMDAGNYQHALFLTHLALRRNGKDLDLRFLQGRLYVLNHFLDSAEDVFKDIIYRNPHYKEVYGALATIEMNRKNAEEALCYVDDGLYYYPADKELALKKFAILQTLQRPQEADAQGNEILQRYNTDTGVLRMYINYKLESAQQYAGKRDYDRALYEYRQVLEVDPENKDAFDGVYSTQLKSGNYEDALAVVNSGLVSHPNDYTLLMRKVSLLQDMRRFPESIEVLQQILKAYPNDTKARQLDIDLRMEAGRYFMGEDPYLQFQGVLEKSPANREALDYVINLASARGLNKDALVFVNKALHYYPADRDLLNKKISILESLQKYPEAAGIAERLWNGSGNAALKAQYMDLREASGRYYMNQLEYDSALADFKAVLDISPGEPAAINYSINILAAQKNYDAAVTLLDKALADYPSSEGLLLKKAGILQDDMRFPEALGLLEQLMNSYPENRRYRSSYIELSMVLGRQMMQVQDYDAAYATFSKVLQLEPDNTEALGTLINIELARGVDEPAQNDTALMLADKALSYYPDSRDFLLKKAAVLEALKRYPEAYSITGKLIQRYPYNTKIRDQYTDELLASGRNYNNLGYPDSALSEFNKVLLLKPRDSTALAYSVNILNAEGLRDTLYQRRGMMSPFAAGGSPGAYAGAGAFASGGPARSDSAYFDSALVLINRALRYYPANEFFTMKRAVVLENMHRFPEAAQAADSVVKINPTDAHKDYASYLHSRTFRNAVGISYLSAHFDSLESANFATLHYVRYSKNGSSFDTKLNFAGRSNGTGLQLEEEIYYTHNSLWTSYGDAAIASKTVFPVIRLAYSLFRNFNHGWEGELGIRYLNLDSLSITSAVGSVAKYIGDFYVNLRGYLIFAPGKMYESGVLTARLYLDNKTDFMYGAIGAGNSPDEYTREYQLNNLLGSQTYDIGAGYQKVFNYRNVLNLAGTWYNQKLAEGRYRNEYDISLSYLRKF